MRVLGDSVTDWLTQWLPTGFDGKVPPNFGPLRIVRFWKMRTFWKAYVLDNAGWSKFGTPPPWNSKFPPFLAISPPFQFPLFLAYLNLSDFDKWGIFGKLTTWTMRETQILGPHPTGIRNFPPLFAVKSDLSSCVDNPKLAFICFLGMRRALYLWLYCLVG